MPDDATTPDEHSPPQRARKYKSYSDVEIANALAVLDSHGGCVYAAAREMSLPPTTLRQWARGECRPIAPELRESSKEALAEQCHALAWDFLEIAERKAEQMHPAQAVVAAGILIDKVAMLRGDATQVIEHRDDSRHAELTARYGDSRKVILVQAAPAGEFPPTGTEGASADGEAPPPPASSGGSAPIVSRPS